MTQHTVVNGIKITINHVVHDVAGPTIVFLHDSLGCIQLWRDFPKQLADATNCNFLVYDRQGYGASAPFGPEPRDSGYLEKEADFLDALLAQLNIEQAILFGHSDGGSIAVIAAAKYPASIRAVISEAAHLFVEEITLNGIRDAVTAYEHTALKRRLERYHGTKTDAVFWAWAGTWLNEAYRDWSIEHFVPRITCPVLVIQGVDDEFGSMRQVTAITNHTAGHAERMILEHTRHNPHRETPELVLRRCVDFLEQQVLHERP
ncbi:MAG: alpha/beta hydrolase [Flavipsychrobacter sp.]|nr:alpha/beta hydrolase [Flavipsychrobacter sp.]